MPTLRKDRLLKLAEFLDTLKPEKFNFNDIVSESKDSCGTVCCAVGWCPTVFPRSWAWFNYGMLSDRMSVTLKTNLKNADSDTDHLVLDWAKCAAEFFGMTLMEAHMLFIPERRRPWASGSKLSYKTKPKTVARSIRSFIDWQENKSN